MVGSQITSTFAGSPQPEGDSFDIRQEIEHERFRTILSMTPPATVLSTLFAMAASGFFFNRLDHKGILAWLALKCLISAVRGFHQWWSRQQGGRLNWQTWRKVSIGLWVAEGATWGLAAIGMLADQPDTSLMLAITVAGVCTMAAFTLQAYWTFIWAYCIPAVLPFVVIFAWQGNEFGAYIAASFVTYAMCLLAVSKRAETRIIENISLRFANARLASERQEALAQLEQQIQEKSLFVATVSHELRTPLHGMLGLARLIQQPHLHPEDQQRLQLIERSGQHLISVLNNILDFSRIEAGHLETVCSAFDLRALCDEVLALHKVQAQAKGLLLQCEDQLTPHSWVMGDAARIRQILLNLIGNAVKFTHQGVIWIHLIRRPSTREGLGPVVCRITDTGDGISAQDLACLFTPFKQARDPQQKQQSGTGLGLTISRAMAHAMGGEITCTSELGRGSTFELELPLVPANTYAPASTESEDFPDTQPPTLDEDWHATVLLAEDNEVNAMVVEAQLRQYGLEVIHCPDGQAVLDHLQGCGASRPDLILMDCQMPLLDGFETTRRIREIERAQGLAALRIIALTANAQEEDCQTCLDSGMDDYLAKPFSAQQLTAMLMHHLQGRISPAQPQALAA